MTASIKNFWFSLSRFLSQPCYYPQWIPTRLLVLVTFEWQRISISPCCFRHGILRIKQIVIPRITRRAPSSHRGPAAETAKSRWVKLSPHHRFLLPRILYHSIKIHCQMPLSLPENEYCMLGREYEPYGIRPFLCQLDCVIRRLSSFLAGTLFCSIRCTVLSAPYRSSDEEDAFGPDFRER